MFPAVFPLSQITFLTPPQAPPPPRDGLPFDIALSADLVFAIVLALVLAFVLVAFLRRIASRPKRAADKRPWVLVDGSNVMHWKDDTPRIATVQAVVRALEQRGFAAGVVFDANAGHKLMGRYLGDREFSDLLGLPFSQVFVVPKGSQADPYLLSAARDFGAKIVTRDRFRDWAEAHPEVKVPGFLIRGGYRSSGELWLDDAATASATAPA